jgi:DNA mismatch repair ATPase MutS
MLAAIERVAFDAPLLRDLATHLSASGTRATRELARLERLVGFLEARNNEGFRLFLGPLLLWDLNFVLALETWRSRVGLQVRRWLQVVAEVEALASLAAFAFERPQCPYAELVSEPRFEAQGLSHPLLAGAVGNDLVLEGPGHALLVTGSNMSGKSTLLRAVGTNVVLAYAGAPVCATRLVLGPVVLATSMRVSDSLARGISHFLAEVQRLREVLDCAKPPAAVLFLLDEILHGTNSRERIIGAKAILRTLLGRGAMGLVSTHDLGLGDFASEPNSRVKNVHFQEQIEGETMTFDFRLREGLVHSSNALRLMKLVGIEVPLDPDAQ